MNIDAFRLEVASAAFYGSAFGVVVICILGLLLEWACKAVRRWSERG